MLDYFFTSRLKCRKITSHDIDIICAWSNNPESYGDFLAMDKMKPNEAQEKLNNNIFWNTTSKTYLIELKDDATPIGTIKYWSKVGYAKTALIALKIAAISYRRKGYGTEVQKALIRELFKKYGYETVEMYTDIANIPQQSCLDKLDFINVKQEDYADAGKNRQGYLFRLTRERYEASGVHLYYYD